MANVRDIITQQIASGTTRGVVALAWRAGQVVVEAYAGEASPGQPMDAQSMILWLSAGKPVVAAGIAVLVEQGALLLDDPVANWISQFAAAGKGGITLRHLLTHTAGLHKALPVVWEVGSWQDAIERICAAEPAYPPGTTAGYDPSASWFILGEIIQRAAGVGFEQFIRDRIFVPCEMSSATFTKVGDEGCLVAYRNTAAGRDRALAWNTYGDFPRPGASLRATIADMAGFYRGLLEGKVIGRETLETFTRPSRGRVIDKTFGVPMDWGLGFMINNGTDVPYHFGRGASTRAFGHGGQQSSIAFCDPLTRTIVALSYNGLPGESAHNRRATQLLEAIWDELG